MDTTKDNAPRVPTKDLATRLQRLEERLANELLSEENRCELDSLVARLRCKLAR